MILYPFYSKASNGEVGDSLRTRFDVNDSITLSSSKGSSQSSLYSSSSSLLGIVQVRLTPRKERKEGIVDKRKRIEDREEVEEEGVVNDGAIYSGIDEIKVLEYVTGGVRAALKTIARYQDLALATKNGNQTIATHNALYFPPISAVYVIVT